MFYVDQSDKPFCQNQGNSVNRKCKCFQSRCKGLPFFTTESSRILRKGRKNKRVRRPLIFPKSVFIRHAFMTVSYQHVTKYRPQKFKRISFVAFLIRSTASQSCFPRVILCCRRYGGICFHIMSNPLSVYWNKRQTDLSGLTSNCHVL